MKIKLEAPKLQIDFAASLKELRSTCLQDALVNTIGEIEIERVVNDTVLAKNILLCSLLAGIRSKQKGTSKMLCVTFD